MAENMIEQWHGGINQGIFLLLWNIVPSLRLANEAGSQSVINPFCQKVLITFGRSYKWSFY